MSAPGDPNTKNVVIRLSQYQHERWMAASEKNGTTMSAFIRDCCDIAAAEVLDCLHPIETRRIYEWSDTCMLCGYRLR